MENEIKKEEPKTNVAKEAAKPVPEMPKEVPKKDEKIFTIPLRKAFRKTNDKRAPYAASLVRNFLKSHLKTADVKLGEQLNKKIWESGNNIPRKIRVKTFKDGETVKAELMGFEYKDFKALPKQERKGMKDKLMDRLGPKAAQKQKEEEMVKGEKAKSPEKPQKMEKHSMDEE